MLVLVDIQDAPSRFMVAEKIEENVLSQVEETEIDNFYAKS